MIKVINEWSLLKHGFSTDLQFPVRNGRGFAIHLTKRVMNGNAYTEIDADNNAGHEVVLPRRKLMQQPNKIKTSKSVAALLFTTGNVQ